MRRFTKPREDLVVIADLERAHHISWFCFHRIVFVPVPKALESLRSRTALALYTFRNFASETYLKGACTFCISTTMALPSQASTERRPCIDSDKKNC